jgi:ectoine hydroxylase
MTTATVTTTSGFWGRSGPRRRARLSRAQVGAFRQDGFLLVEGVFGAEEVDAIRAGVPHVLGDRSERRVMEGSGAAVRSVYGPHQHDGTMAALARHPRLVESTRDLLHGDVYVYQSKLNVKAAFVGEVWEWHQDYVFWREEDAMPAPRALTAAVFLDDVTDENGPMRLLPGSQQEGVLPCEGQRGPTGDGLEWMSHVSASLKYTLDTTLLGGLTDCYGLTAATGPAGSVLFFDANVAHASPPNLSPFDRALMMFTYNHVDNAAPTGQLTRPEFLVSRDSRPIRSVADEIFLATRQASA